MEVRAGQDSESPRNLPPLQGEAAERSEAGGGECGKLFVRRFLRRSRPISLFDLARKEKRFLDSKEKRAPTRLYRCASDPVPADIRDFSCRIQIEWLPASCSAERLAVARAAACSQGSAKRSGSARNWFCQSIPPCRICFLRACFATARKKRGCGDSVPPSSAPGSGGPQSHDCTQIGTMSDDRDDQPGHGTQVHRVGALFFWFHLAAFAFYGPASRRPAKSAAAEIPCRLLLPPAAAARNPGRGPSSFRQDEKKMDGALRRNRLVNRPRIRVQPLRLALLGTSPCRGGLEKRIAAPVRCKQKSPAGAGDLDSRFAFNGS